MNTEIKNVDFVKLVMIEFLCAVFFNVVLLFFLHSLVFLLSYILLHGILSTLIYKEILINHATFGCCNAIVLFVCFVVRDQRGHLVKTLLDALGWTVVSSSILVVLSLIPAIITTLILKQINKSKI